MVNPGNTLPTNYGQILSNVFFFVLFAIFLLNIDQSAYIFIFGYKFHIKYAAIIRLLRKIFN